MSDHRSTRRQSAPVPGPAVDAPKKSSREDERLEHVSSATDGIDDAVVGPHAQIANTKHAPDKFNPHDTARMQPPGNFHINDDDASKAFDIHQLEQELDVAIAAELGETQADTAPLRTATPTHSEVRIKATETLPCDLGETTTPAHTSTPLVRLEEAEDAAPAEPEHSFAAFILAPCTRPVQRLSPNGRMLLNIVVISTALWVPLVWLMVTTDGFGFMNTVQLQDGPLEPAAIASEPAADH